MKFKALSIFSILLCVYAGAAHAGWQYPGHYLGDGWYQDDGSRFVLSVRGGASLQRGKINNEIGSMSALYYINQTDGIIMTAAEREACGTNCDGTFQYAGMGNLGDLPAEKNLSTFSFAAGASIGWTVPNSPQWRVELGWDHIAQSEYNAAPLFAGKMDLQGGEVSGVYVDVQSGGAHSNITTDIFSAMAFYDFFDGIKKPVKSFIPYIGFGVGYANSTTVLNLSDLYGDLLESVELQEYGVADNYVLRFYTSENNTANVAGLLALGFSYGLTETTFLDLGARVTYVPKVIWALSNEDGSKHRDWYSAKNIIYTNVMLGIRFEF
ncbi:MAG: hypothetical protein LBJ73_02400 [Rickettsiales bacterium]|nr:hypothetical protein [Rickettsiales bacterium]